MTGDCHVRICEGLWVKSPRSTLSEATLLRRRRDSSSSAIHPVVVVGAPAEMAQRQMQAARDGSRAPGDFARCDSDFAGKRTTFVPARVIIPRNVSEYFVSRSMMRYRASRRKPSWVSVTLRAICVIHALSGCGVHRALDACESSLLAPSTPESLGGRPGPLKDAVKAACGAVRYARTQPVDPRRPEERDQSIRRVGLMNPTRGSCTRHESCLPAMSCTWEVARCEGCRCSAV
jgi:hypothetical protein